MSRKTESGTVLVLAFTGISLFFPLTKTMAVPEEWLESVRNAGVYTNTIPDADLKTLLGDVDMMDVRTVVIHQRAINSGAALHPFLAEVLKREQSFLAEARILSIFIKSTGNKTVALEATRELLARNQGKGKDEARTRASVARTFGKIGAPNDRELLYPLLSDSNLPVRVNAAKALGCLGDESDIGKLSAIEARRREGRTPEEIKRDSTLKALEKSVDAIRKRLAEKQKTQGAEEQ